MKTNKQIYVRAILVFLLCSTMLCAELIDTGFTYQGRLLDVNTQDPVNGEYDLRFILFDGSIPLTSNPIGLPITLEDVQIVDGYFTTELDFGISAFRSVVTWLQVSIRPGGSTDPDDFVVLSPLQKISTAASWSMYASIVTGTVSTRWITETTDINSFGTNWEEAEVSTGNWLSVAMTHEGQNQAAVDFNDGEVYISADYGKTWNFIHQFDYAKFIAISANGKYITAVRHPGDIQVSSDSGETWVPKGPDNGTFTSVAMSANGKIQTAVAENGDIYNSQDYGITWDVEDNYDWYWQSAAMSMDGICQVVVSSDGALYISTNGGSDWNPKFQNLAASFLAVAMSADGKVATVVTELINGYNVYTLSITDEIALFHNNVPGAIDVAISEDGTIQTVVTSGGPVYVSTDSGENWEDKGPSAIWRSVAMSADAAVQTAGVHQGQIYYSTAKPFVGIGTQTPTAALHVNGTVKASKFEGDGSGLSNIAGIETDPTVLESVKDGISWDEISNRPVGLDDGDNDTHLSEAQVDSYVANNGYLTLATDQVGSNTTSHVSKWNGSELVTGTIFDNGNIGIGTESPTARLDVNGTAKIATANILAWQNQSVSPNGYAWVGSILFQWGTGETTASDVERFTFPTTFPNACFSVMINRQTYDARYPLEAQSFNKSGFEIDRINVIVGSYTFNYIAIGY